MKKSSLQTKKTFTRSEVEEYVKKMLTSSEITMCEQKDRIVELKHEIDKLNRALSEKEDKLKMVERGLKESDRVNKQAGKEATLQTKLVVQKVQQFGFKWKNYFAELFADIEALRGNASADLFAEDVNELISEVIEATNFRGSLDEKSVPINAEVCLNEDEWLENKIKKLSGEPKYSLSEENEERYKEVMDRLKKQMIYASELGASGAGEFNIEEALNPKDSLDKIINDLKD